MHSTRKGEQPPEGETITVITPGEDPRRFRAELEAELEATKRELETTKRELERAKTARPDDDLLEHDEVVDHWATVSQLAKAREEIRTLTEENRALRRADIQPG